MTLFQRSSAESQLRSCFTAFRDCTRRRKDLKLKVSFAKNIQPCAAQCNKCHPLSDLHALLKVQCPTLLLGVTSASPGPQVATCFLKRYQYSAFQAWHSHTVWVRAVKAKVSYLHRLIITKTASQVRLSILLSPHDIFRLSLGTLGCLEGSWSIYHKAPEHTPQGV